MLQFTLGDIVHKTNIDLAAHATRVRMPDAIGAEAVQQRFVAKFWSRRFSEHTDGTLIVTNCRLAFVSMEPPPCYFLSVPWSEIDALENGRVAWLFPALIVRVREEELRFVFIASSRAARTAAERARSAFRALSESDGSWQA